MYISEAKIDSKGRITLPKKFLEANDIDEGTIVRFQTIQGQNNTIKMIFEPKFEKSERYEAVA